jgi:hypothetical protein
MNNMGVHSNLGNVLPKELSILSSFHLWKYSSHNKGKPTKTPINKSGYPVGYNDISLPMPFPEAFNVAKANDWGVGITLKDGIYIEALQGYLWCIDFDGFAELKGTHVDDGVIDILDKFNSYTEMSPSGTGFKVFLVSDKPPIKKMKILFSKSSFAEKFPDIDKYKNRAIEIFSQNLFLALTGDLFSQSKYHKLQMIKSKELEKLISDLDMIAKKSGGLGLNTAPPSLSAIVPLKEKNRLEKDSLTLLLSFINADDEETWTDVANALARVYGEDGRKSFHIYSNKSNKYDEDTCNNRYNRALNELSHRPDGFGIKRLLDLAKLNPNWNNPKLISEIDIDVSGLDLTLPKEDWRKGITAEELSTKKFKPLMWVVEDILPEGCYILSARPKVGKSWLSLQISLAVAFGERTLGKNVVKGKSIYLALEDNPRRLQSRLDQLKPNGYSTDSLLLFTDWPSFDNNGIVELINLIIKEEPKLVVIDTLARVRPASRSTHVYENDYKTLAPLTAIANKYRLCILIVTHNRKGKSENDALEQVSGSLGLTGAVDGALVIDGIRTDKQYKLSLIGRDIPNDDELAIARESNGEWKILGSASQVFVSEERKAILDLLYMHPSGLKPKDIADLLDKNSGAVRKLLLTMSASLQVINDNGIYKHTNPIGISSSSGGVGNIGNSSNII